MVPEPLVGAILLLTVVLAYVNGFHDASNAVSTTITTGTLRERTALGMAALLNLLGALLGMGLVTMSGAWAFSKIPLGGLADDGGSPPHLVLWVLLAAVATTVLWDLATWWRGMPSSSWHALYGAIGGASLVLGWHADWSAFLGDALMPTAFVPLLGALAAYLLMHGITRLLAKDRLVSGHVRFAQTVSAGAVATAHGLQDVLIPMAVVVAVSATAPVPPAMLAAAPFVIALALATGTYMGGHRIIRTLGTRLTDLSSPQGFAAEASTAALMGVVTLGFGMPVSSSHAIAAGVMGAGLARGRRALRLPVVWSILVTWIATPVACLLLGMTIARLAQTLLGA
ncbi:inorganic phosphate transporter [Brachybacterium hainanense]|uniref:Anion permease n=1 Tax=Brachybacterium hainanense TaxID=1541174 RepID=A0ABV6RED5_9MICO